MENSRHPLTKKSTHIKIYGRYIGYVWAGDKKIKVPVKETSGYYIDPAGMKFDKKSGEIISWGSGNQSARHGIFENNDYSDTYLIIDSLNKDQRAHRRKPGRKFGAKFVNGVLLGNHSQLAF